MSREILRGPAGSGKTRSVLDEYVDTIRASGEDAALLVLPSRLASERVRRRLVADGRVRGLLDARILTFPDLAQLILDANHANVTRISDLQQRLLMREVTDELRAEGELEALAAMCDFPGFLDSVGDLINELKRIAIDSESFAQRVSGAAVDADRGREIAAIYRRYQRHLQAPDPPLYDEPGAFWWARDLLHEGRRRPFEGLQSILVAGFDDFTTTQLQVLKELASGDGVRRLLIALPLDEDDPRRELFRRPRRTLGRIREILGGIECTRVAGETADRPLARMGARLFAEGEAQPLTEGADRVRIIEATGRRMEVRRVLGRVKQLLREGVDPATIGLVARDLSGYAAALQEVARELSVPVRVRASERLSSRPSVQAVLDVVRVPAEQFPAADVMRLIKSTCFDRSVLGDDAPEPDEIERICAEAAIIGGRAAPGRSPLEHWRERLDRHARRLRQQRARSDGPEYEGRRRDPETLAEEMRTVERAQVALGRLFERFEPLHAASTLRERVAALARVMEALGVTAGIDGGDSPHVTAANIRALNALLGGLRELASAGERLSLAADGSLADFRDEVQRVADGLSFVPPGPDTGVPALDADQAARLSFDHVFLLGMSERQFPRVAREDAVFDDEQRDCLGRAGIPLDRRSDATWEDAFLFYTIAASTGECLTLSYPRADAEGHEVLASWYVDEVRRCFAADVEPARFGLADAIPGFEDAASRRELLERSLLEAFGREPRGADRDLARARSGLGALAGQDGELLAALRPLIEIEDRRRSRAPEDEYDARLADPAAIAAVREMYAPDRPLSASALGTFGRCPFTFFAQRVLDLSALETPSEEADRAAIGSIVHRCLRAFFREWGRGGRIEPGQMEEARRVLEEVMARVFGEEQRLGAFADEAVFRAARGRWERNLRLWLAWEVEALQADGHRVRSSEQRFGYPDSAPAVVLGAGDDQVLLRGAVDRIDDLPAVETGRAFAVYDYKTGSTGTKRDIQEGRDFQLPVYALAAREMLDDPDAVCAHWGLYSLRRPIGIDVTPKKGEPVAEIEELTQQARDWAIRHARAIRAGEFSPAPPDRCGFCNFRLICRWDEYRFDRKGGSDDE